jgi:hypothetical protein
MAAIGEEQLEWIRADLAAQPKDARIVVFTHRPLFDLYPQWDWATQDGARAIELLQTHDNVTVFYGHIHQENHFMTGNIAHHAAKGTHVRAAGGLRRSRGVCPIPWDASAPYKGLGYREVEAEVQARELCDFRISGGLKAHGHATSSSLAAARREPSSA